MTYKQRYLLENEKAFKQADKYLKIINTIVMILVFLGMIMIMIGLSALDFNPVKGVFTTIAGILIITIVLAITRLLGIDIFEDSADED